jgi:hypothetical protein
MPLQATLPCSACIDAEGSAVDDPADAFPNREQAQEGRRGSLSQVSGEHPVGVRVRLGEHHRSASSSMATHS